MITKTVGFRILGLDRKGYMIHTDNAVYSAEPSGSQGYIMTGQRYKSLKACKQAILSGGVVEQSEPEIEPESKRSRGLMEPPCNPVYLFAVLLGEHTWRRCGRTPRKPTEMELEVLDCFGLVDPESGKIDYELAKAVVEAQEEEFRKESS